jgi:hypothetical protein
MSRSPISVDGNTLYPVGGGLLDDRLINRPAYGGGSLLDGGKDFASIRQNFSGGRLNGEQYNPYTNKFEPLAPSGLFSGTAPEGSNFGGEGEEQGDGEFTLNDLMQFQTSLGQANFGNQDPQSVFRSFTDAGGGTFNIADASGSGPLASYFYGTDNSGNSVPLNKATYKKGSMKGQTLTPGTVRGLINASLRGIDESGGNEGTGGADGPGGGNESGAGGNDGSSGSSSGNDGSSGNDSTGGDGPSI